MKENLNYKEVPLLKVIHLPKESEIPLKGNSRTRTGKIIQKESYKVYYEKVSPWIRM